jgi:hypothetical protein
MAQAHGLMPRDMVAGTQAVDPAEAAKFASLPLELEADELLVLVEGILARGASVESVFIDLLAPSARRLGQHWEDDDCDFVDVTMGLWRLQEVMREVTLRFPPPRAGPPTGRAVCPAARRRAQFRRADGGGSVCPGRVANRGYDRAGTQGIAATYCRSQPRSGRLDHQL